MLPVAYNLSRLNTQPAPSNVSGEQLNEECDEEDKFVLPTVHMDSTDLVALDGIMTDDSVDNYTSDENDDDAESTNTNEEPNEQGESDGIENNTSHESDDELNLENNLLTDNEANNDTGNVAGFSATFNDNISSRYNNILVQSSENETVDLMENGQIRITQVFADGMEMSYIHGQKLRIPKDPYQVKENDELSGNLPFKENVCIELFSSNYNV